MPECEVHLKAGGPLLAEKRALTWAVPRLGSNDDATYSLTVSPRRPWWA